MSIVFCYQGPNQTVKSTYSLNIVFANKRLIVVRAGMPA